MAMRQHQKEKPAYESLSYSLHCVCVCVFPSKQRKQQENISELQQFTDSIIAPDYCVLSRG